MTKAQIKALSIIRDALDKKGIEHDSCSAKDFLDEIKASDVNSPWKILNEHLTGEIYNLTELFTNNLPNTIAEFTDEYAQQPKEETEDTNQPSTESIEKTNTKTSRKKALKDDTKELTYRRPVYVVEVIDSSQQSSVVGVTEHWRTAWDNFRNQALHDKGTRSEAVVKKEIEVHGFSYVSSKASKYLICRFTKMELI